MDRDTADLNLVCIERVIEADWCESPERLFGYQDTRFRERDLREERDRILGSVWAPGLFAAAQESSRSGFQGSADLSCGADPTLSARSDVEEMLAAMSHGELPSRSAEYLELCDRVAEAVAKTDPRSVDIEEWSRKLADDLSRFSD